MTTTETGAFSQVDRNPGRRQVAVGLVLVGLAALPFLAEALGQSSFTGLATRMLIYGIAAASLNLALGYGGLISFGHAAFFGIGGYVVGILSQAYRYDELVFGIFPGTNQLLVSLPLAILVSGVAAAVIGGLSLRTSGVQFIMITLAFAQMVFFLFVSLKAYGGSDGMSLRRANELFGLSLRDRMTMYYVALAVAAGVGFLYHRIVRSRFGTVIIGLRQNQRRMAAIGLPPYPYKLAAFVISGMGAGLAGALMANFMRYVSPDMLHWTKSGDLMIMVILGGVGTLLGPFVGAAVFVLLESLLSSWTENWPLGLGIVLLIVVLYTKGGIHALASRLGGRSR